MDWEMYKRYDDDDDKHEIYTNVNDIQNKDDTDTDTCISQCCAVLCRRKNTNPQYDIIILIVLHKFMFRNLKMLLL